MQNNAYDESQSSSERTLQTNTEQGISIVVETATTSKKQQNTYCDHTLNFFLQNVESGLSDKHHIKNVESDLSDKHHIKNVESGLSDKHHIQKVESGLSDKHHTDTLEEKPSKILRNKSLGGRILCRFLESFELSEMFEE